MRYGCTIGDLLVAWCVTVGVIPFGERDKTKQCSHVILGVLFPYGLYFLTDGDITNFDGIEQTEPFAEASHSGVKALTKFTRPFCIVGGIKTLVAHKVDTFI